MSQEKLSALLAVMVPAVLQCLMEKCGINSKEAAALLYSSDLYEMLENEESKLWHLSAQTLYSLLEQELNSGFIWKTTKRVDVRLYRRHTQGNYFAAFRNPERKGAENCF
jgi:hypothetical protein